MEQIGSYGLVCGLTFWVATISLLAISVGPRQFALMPEHAATPRHAAGSMLRAILRHVHRFEWGSLTLAATGLALRLIAGVPVSVALPIVLTAMMLCLAVYSFLLAPRMQELATMLGAGFDQDRPELRAAKDTFRRGHRVYCRLMALNVILAILAIALTLKDSLP